MVFKECQTKICLLWDGMNKYEITIRTCNFVIFHFTKFIKICFVICATCVLCMSHCHFCSYTFRWGEWYPILFGYLIRFKSSSIWLQTVLIEIWSFSTLTFSCHFYLICVCLFSLLFSLLFLFVNLSSAVNGFVCVFFQFILNWNDFVLNEPISVIDAVVIFPIECPCNRMMN